MIGYYIHHHGRGHLSRALAIAAAIEGPVTALSSLPAPPEWSGDWVQLPADEATATHDADAHGRLHWAPLGHDGLRGRMARIARWIDEQQPEALVVDVSVEVALLARLHGVPVVAIAMPGQRTDPAHELGYAIAEAVIGTWPPEATGMTDGLPDLGGRLHAVGAISRFAPARPTAPADVGRRVVVFGGAGGDTFTADAVGRARDATPGWTWTHLGANGSWTDDPWAALLDASVVITHAGEGAIAEVAAARRPAIVIPQPRPHGEQERTAAVLSDPAWPALVLPHWPTSHWPTSDWPTSEWPTSEWPTSDWPALLAAAVALDGGGWQAWNDGSGAQRAAAVIAAAVERRVPA